MIWLIVGLVLFHGLHSIRIVAPNWRDAKVAETGEPRWKGLYSVASIVALGLIIWGYSIARLDADFIYAPPVWGRHLNWLLMILAMIALAASQLPAGKLKAVLKHPLLVSVKLWALAHLLANGDTASLLLFGTFLAWAVVDRISLKRRSAPISAPGSVIYDLAAIVVGIGLYLALVFWAHEWLFGIAPV